MTIVIDCNILVICLTSRSPYHNIYQAIIKGKVDLAVSTDIVLEYQEIIDQKYGITTANAFVALLNELPNVHLITTYYHWQLIAKDADDNKYCDCAIAAQRQFDLQPYLQYPVYEDLENETFCSQARVQNGQLFGTRKLILIPIAFI